MDSTQAELILEQLSSLILFQNTTRVNAVPSHNKFPTDVRVHLIKVQFSPSSSEFMRKCLFARLNVQGETNRNFHKKCIY